MTKSRDKCCCMCQYSVVIKQRLYWLHLLSPVHRLNHKITCILSILQYCLYHKMCMTTKWKYFVNMMFRTRKHSNCSSSHCGILERTGYVLISRCLCCNRCEIKTNNKLASRQKTSNSYHKIWHCHTGIHCVSKYVHILFVKQKRNFNNFRYLKSREP